MILLVSITSMILIILEVILDEFRNFRVRFSTVRDIGRGFVGVGCLGCFIIIIRVIIRCRCLGSLGLVVGLCIIGLVAFLTTLIWAQSSHLTPQTDSSPHTK